MSSLRALNTSKNVALAVRVRSAKSLIHRTVGLLGTSQLPEGEGLWLAPCPSIHTFFMRYPIDVVFLDAAGTVLYQATLPPWRITRFVAHSRGALELSAGTLQRTQTVVGDRIELKEEA
jgi:uncharacterized protein